MTSKQEQYFGMAMGLGKLLNDGFDINDCMDSKEYAEGVWTLLRVEAISGYQEA